MNRRRELPTPPHSSRSDRRPVPIWNMRSPRSPTPQNLPVVDLRFSGRRPAIHRWKSIMRKIPTNWNSARSRDAEDRLPSISGSQKVRAKSMFEPSKQKTNDVVLDVRSFSPLFKPKLTVEKRIQSPSKKRVEFAEQKRLSVPSSTCSFPFTVPSFHTYRNSGVFSPFKKSQRMHRWTPLQLPVKMENQLQESKEALGRVALLKWKDIRDTECVVEKGDLADRDNIPAKLKVSRELRQVIEEDYTDMVKQLPRLHILRERDVVGSLATGELEQIDDELDKEKRVFQWITNINQMTEKKEMLPVLRTESFGTSLE